jgi:hypothetical protein
MKISVAVLMVVSSFAIPLASQTAGFGVAGMEGLGQTGPTANAQPPTADPCPVLMRAQQTAGGDLLATGTSRAKPAGQGLHLTLTNLGSKQITGASITVSGLTGTPHIVQAHSSSGAPSETEKQLSLTFHNWTGKAVSRDFWATGMTSIQTIDLNSVTYADGSTWKLAAGKSCRTIPDRLMLIGSR